MTDDMLSHLYDWERIAFLRDRSNDRSIRVAYDPAADALTITLEGREPYPEGQMQEVAPGILADYDIAGNLAVLLIEDLTTRTSWYGSDHSPRFSGESGH